MLLWVSNPWEGYSEVISHDDGGFYNEDVRVPYGVFVECYEGMNSLGIADPISTTDAGSWEDVCPVRAEGWNEGFSRYVILDAEERDRIVDALNAMVFEDE